MTKHTPGPWVLEEESRTRRRIRANRKSDGKPVTVALVESWMTQADACLMSAAPEMFKELDAILAALENDEAVTIEPGSVKAARIRDAVLRAQGEGKS